ncbi:hypothetical protein EDD18DRAFT_1100882 [Armillaria luteobubalina]|uniref:Uncharacterized protein n=1 Tax=Armillaria luteobubalina TaxID=153913 RepID=A0AA39UTF9_9AGAR|nr:hypothetical protein EDD18DRAFT_1100882 [Armillaria luteobubalina]
MDNSGLGSIDLDYGNGQPMESNTGIAESPPRSWIVNSVIHGFPNDQPIPGMSNGIQFSRDENDVIEQLMVCAIQDRDTNVMSSTAGDEGIRDESIKLNSDHGLQRSDFRAPSPQSQLIQSRERSDLQSQAISALQEKNLELERQLLEAKQSYDSMIAKGRDIIAQKNREIKDNCQIQAEAHTDTLIKDLKQLVEKCSRYEADRSSLQEKLRQYQGNGMPTLETAVKIVKPHIDKAMRRVKLHYKTQHEETKKTATATLVELQSLRAVCAAATYSTTGFHHQQQPQLPPKLQSSVHQQQHQQQPSTFAYQQPQPFGYQMTFTQQQVLSSFEAHKEPQSSAHWQPPPPPTFMPQPFGHQQPPPPPPTFAYQQPQLSGYQMTLTQQQGPPLFKTHQGPQSSALSATTTHTACSHLDIGSQYLHQHLLTISHCHLPKDSNNLSETFSEQIYLHQSVFSQQGVGKWPGAAPLNSSNQGHPQRNDLSNSDSGEEGDSSDVGNHTKKIKKKKKNSNVDSGQYEAKRTEQSQNPDETLLMKAIHAYQCSLLLSIKTDKDIHSAVSHGCYTNLDQANTYKSGDRSTLLSLSPLRPCWEHINHDWNFALKDLFVAGFISIQKKKHPDILALSDNPLDDTSMAHSNTPKQWAIDLDVVQGLQLCMNNDWQEAFLILFHILETCSAVYMSSDESGDESVLQQYGFQEKHVVLVRQKEWHSSEVLQLLKWLDRNQATVN